MNKHITIIGAGIGGLTAALALKLKGCQVTIYESALEIKPVGAGIVMASNAMQIFRKLGIHHKIENAGNRVSCMKITDENLRPISVMKLSKFEEKYGVYNVAIHRGELQRILAEEIGYENIRLAKRLSKIEHDGAYTLTFDDNTGASGDIVIGADGIKSTVRNQLFKMGEIRDTKQVCWRGICEMELSEELQHEAIEAWGKGTRFGFVKIGHKKSYWYAVANQHLVQQAQDNLTELFKTYHPDVLEIISQTPSEKIMTSKITDLRPIATWHLSNACLIGDAAHATTPNMGQGACQAVEDAYTLGQLFMADKPTEEIFAEYESLRIRKAHDIVKKSWTIGKVAHIENHFGIWLRNTLMRNVPQSANAKQLENVFDLAYIDDARFRDK